jgi:hypothetical protein
MSSPPPDDGNPCPDCGASLPGEANYCWLCGKALQEGGAGAAGSAGPVERRAAYQFSLSSLLLIITLVAVLLGVFRIAPGVALALAFLTAPALVKTCIAVARRKARGQRVAPLAKLGIFAGSLGIVIVVVAATIAAFFAVCFTVLADM